ncbi:MAG: RsbRD N-terminal domain-containing protein [Thermodesulfovibrionales bacterium]|nr:RsbRD N-terminal domain-containing protein [Thermodesulfovibrionales bacterium]
MTVQSLLSEKKEQIAKKWFELVADSYPSQTSDFLKSKKNQFLNPVGFTLKEGLSGICNELSLGMDESILKKCLDDIIRIRAIQDFSPSEAISFVFLLKKVIQEVLPELSEDAKEYVSVMVEKIALMSFDIYMQCREDLFEIRVREAEKRNFRLLQVANQLMELKDERVNDLVTGVIDNEKGKG